MVLSEIIRHPSTRRALLGIVGSTAAACGISPDTPMSQPPFPTATRRPATPVPTVARRPDITVVTSTEVLQDLFNTSKRLAQEFPVFSDAAHLEDDFRKLDREGTLQPDDSPLSGRIAYIGSIPNVSNGIITNVRTILFITKEFFLFSPEDQTIVLLNQFAKHNVQEEAVLNALKGKPERERTSPVVQLGIAAKIQEAEYGNYFKSVQQLDALKKRPQGFRSRIAGLETPPAGTSIQLYNLYLDIMQNDQVKDAANKRWREEVDRLTNYFSRQA